MPFPANWLEELVIEWLDLEGFVISTSVSVPAKAGGRLSPDVVGAKLDANGCLLIRHCEAAMYLVDNPEKVAERYSKKFSQDIEKTVRDHFAKIFGPCISKQAKYEKWVIGIDMSKNVQNALKEKEKIPGIQIHRLEDFIRKHVLPAIGKWQAPPNKNTTAIPADKWLLHMTDSFRYVGLIAGEKPGLIKPGGPDPGATKSKAAVTKTSPAKTGPKP